MSAKSSPTEATLQGAVTQGKVAVAEHPAHVENEGESRGADTVQGSLPLPSPGPPTVAPAEPWELLESAPKKQCGAAPPGPPAAAASTIFGHGADGGGHPAVPSSSVTRAAVLILGAGLAGIGAGKVLAEGGVADFVILEAAERVGGRLRGAQFGGHFVELGANWVAGVKDDTANPMWRVANDCNMRMVYSNFDSIAVYDARGRVPEEEVPWDFMRSTYAFGEELGRLYRRLDRPDISLRTMQHLARFAPSTPIENVVDYITYDFEYGEEPRHSSLRNTMPLLTYEDFGRETWFVADPRGVAHMADTLAASYLAAGGDGRPADRRLRLGEQVVRVAYSDDGVEVETAGGHMYSAPVAICTFSLGVLQSSDDVCFQPPLPDWKMEAVFKFNMTCYTKIFLHFPYRFWPEDQQFFLYADVRRGYYPVWQALDAEYSGGNLLLVTVTDNEAKRVEQQPAETTRRECMALLRTMFGPRIPEATSILVPKWWTDKRFRGAYSNWPIGVGVGDFERLKAPVAQRLFFAGEHTHAKYNGFMHGALASGYETATDVLAALGKRKQKAAASAAPQNSVPLAPATPEPPAAQSPFHND